MSDEGHIARERERHLAAAHKVQSAVLFSERPADEYKDLRTGVNMAMADLSGLARLLIDKGVITLEEYFTAVADSAEREAEARAAELSEKLGRPVTLV